MRPFSCCVWHPVMRRVPSAQALVEQVAQAQEHRHPADLAVDRPAVLVAPRTVVALKVTLVRAAQLRAPGWYRPQPRRMSPSM